MPFEDGVNIKPLDSNGVEAAALHYDGLGYITDNPKSGLEGVVNDRRVHNPVRRSKPAGR